MFGWFKRAPLPTQKREVVRLTAEEYTKLEARLPNTHAPSTGTPEEYCYRLGVQHALRIIREGWVIDDR